MQETPGCCFILPLRFFLFGLRLPLLALENEGCGQGRHGQGDDPNQHASVAGGGGAAVVGAVAGLIGVAELLRVRAQGVVGAVEVLELHALDVGDGLGGIEVNSAAGGLVGGAACVHILHSGDALLRAAAGGVVVIGDHIPLIQGVHIANNAAGLALGAVDLAGERVIIDAADAVTPALDDLALAAQDAADPALAGDVAGALAVLDGHAGGVGGAVGPIAGAQDAACIALGHHLAGEGAVFNGAGAHGLALLGNQAAHAGFAHHSSRAGAVGDNAVKFPGEGAHEAIRIPHADIDALGHGAVADGHDIRAGGVAANEAGILNGCAREDVAVVNVHGGGAAGVIIAVVAVVHHIAVNEAVAVNFCAVNLQILDGGLPNDIEQGLAALGNAHGVVPAIQGAGEG